MHELELLCKWETRARAAMNGHDKTASMWSAVHRVLGVLIIGLSMAAALGAVGSLGFDDLQTWIRAVLGALSASAVVLASLSTFLNPGGLAESHRASARRYGSVRRRMEILCTSLKTSGTVDTAKLHEVELELNSISEGGPTFSNWLHRREKEKVDNDPGLCCRAYSAKTHEPDQR